MTTAGSCGRNGGFMVSIKEVAKHAGVAISTVSKVLNGYPNVSEETKKKVQDAIKELNYIPLAKQADNQKSVLPRNYL